MSSSSSSASGWSPRRTTLPFFSLSRAVRRQRLTSLSLSWLVVLAGLIVWGNGCTARRPSPPPSPPQTLAPLPSAQELLAPLQARQQTITGLRGLAKVSYRDTHEKGSATQAVALAAPDRFRLELFTLLGVAAIHTCDGQQLAAYLPRDKVLYRGVASPFNIARLTQVLLSAREITRLLMGLPPFPVEGTAAPVRREPTSTYRLDFRRPNGSLTTLRFDSATKRLTGWAVRDATGTLQAQGELSDYRQVQDIFFPFAIRLSDAQGAQQVSLAYQEVSVGPVPSAALFRLDTPTGVEEIDIDAYRLHRP